VYPYVRGGTLAAFLTEGFPESARFVFNTDAELWGNRGDPGAPHDFSLTYRGDPVSGNVPGCTGPETDVAGDDWYCPTVQDAVVCGPGGGLCWRLPNVPTPTCATGRCYEFSQALTEKGCCGPSPAADCPPWLLGLPGTPSPGGLICRSGLAFFEPDWHVNSGWFLSVVARMTVGLGRLSGLRFFGSLINSGIRESTTVSRGLDSLYEKAVAAADADVEVWRAFLDSVGEGAVRPSAPDDDETDYTHHGDWMSPCAGAFSGLPAGACWEAQGTVNEESPDIDNFNVWLRGNRSYTFSVETDAAPPGSAVAVAVTRDETLSSRRTVPCGGGPTVTGVIPLPVWAPPVTAGTFVPPQDGVYSVAVIGLLAPGVSGKHYRLVVDGGDDYPNARGSAAPLAQLTGMPVGGQLEGTAVMDRDVFSVDLQARAATDPVATVRLTVRDGTQRLLRVDAYGPSASGGGLDLIGSCFGPSAASASCDVLLNDLSRAGRYFLEVVQLGAAPSGASSAIAYWISFRSVVAPRCDLVAPPPDPSGGVPVPDGCELGLEPLYAGALSAGETKELWFEAHKGRIVSVSATTGVDVALHYPAARDWITGGTAGPGTSANPIWATGPEWRAPLTFVAPVDGWYRVSVTRRAGMSTTRFHVRFLQTAYKQCDIPDIVETLGGPVSPAPATPPGWPWP
jgi:hypothetical protein